MVKKLINNPVRLMIFTVSIVLAVLIGFTTPTQFFAQGTNVQYLSEIKLWYATNKDAAKSGLEGEGFTFVDKNLNEGTDKDEKVYLGYKTTTNEKEAITDIRMLGMDSGYQLYNYKEAMEYLEKAQSGTAQTMLSAAKEFRSLYKEGSPKAQSAYQALNLFYVDEAKMKLGDYIVKGKSTLTFFMKMIVKSSSTTLSAVIAFLNAGCAPYENEYDDETDEAVTKNWAQMFPESALWDKINDGLSTSQEQDLRKQYHDTAVSLFKQIQDFTTNYENALMRNPSGTAEVDESVTNAREAVDAEDDVEQEDADGIYLGAFDMLDKYEFDADRTVADWIIDIGHETSASVDYTQLYPLVAAMGDVQADIVGSAGFMTAVSNLGENNRVDALEKLISTIKNEIKDYNNSDSISIWDNADSDIENSKIAITSEAIRKNAAQHIAAENQDDLVTKEKYETAMKWIGMGMGIIYVATFVTTKALMYIASTAVSAAVTSFVTSALTVVNYIAAVNFWLGVAAALVTLVMMIYFAVLEAQKDSKIDHTEVPSYVIDSQETDKDDITVKYKVALCNEKKNEAVGYHGDLNACQQQRWAVLCTTTNPLIGSPIRMDDDNNIFKVNYGNGGNVNGYSPLRNFGEISAADANAYCKENSVGGIYIFYRSEESMNDASPSSGGSDSEKSGVAKNGYISKLCAVTASDAVKAKAKITAKEGKYYIFDNNLSPGTGKGHGAEFEEYATYIGYTVTYEPSKAVTDVRVVPYNGTKNQVIQYGDIKYYFCGIVGVISDSTDKPAEDQCDALFYTTDERAGSPLGVDSFHVVNKWSDVEDGWEPVTTLGGGIPYDFSANHAGNKENLSAVHMYNQKWDRDNLRYLYYEPTVKYTSGEKYLSGIFFINGAGVKYSDISKRYYDIKKQEDLYHYSYLKDKVKTMKNAVIVDVDLKKSMNHIREDCIDGMKMQLVYTYSYNPYRAIYDIGAMQSSTSSNSVPYTIVKKQENGDKPTYVACTSIIQYKYRRYYSPANSYINPCANYSEDLGKDYVFDDDDRFIKSGTNYLKAYFKYNAFPTIGLYVTGYTKSKTPIRLRDVVMSTTEYEAKVENRQNKIDLSAEKTLEGSSAEGAFHPVTFLQTPNATKPLDLAYPTVYEDDGEDTYNGSHLFIYLAGASRAKLKYISSLSVGAYSSIRYTSETGITDSKTLVAAAQSYDMLAYAEALNESVDEVCAQNLGYTQKYAWYNYASYNHNGIGMPDLGKFYCSAYVGVTRTDNPDKAITGAILLENNADVTYKTIKLGRVEYYCDSPGTPIVFGDINKKYFLYYTYNTGVNAGQPIEDISVDGIALVKGATTVICGKEGSANPHVNTKMESFLHLFYNHDVKDAFFNKLYVGTGKDANGAMLQLLKQGCTECFDYNLSKDNLGNAVYLGYRYGAVDMDEVNSKKTEAKRQAELDYQMSEAVTDVVVTRGEPYHPDGFVGENHVYYYPVGNVNLSSGSRGYEMYFYYACNFRSELYNKNNGAETYLPTKLFSPIKAFAFARYDRVPYNTDMEAQSGGTDLERWEYVLFRDESVPADMNAGSIELDGKLIKSDNRITMFAQRMNGDVKPEAEITGGYVSDTTNKGELYLQHQD